jgi:autotransporter-associated beta strand protein
MGQGRRRTRTILFAVLSALIGALAIPGLASAATVTWDGGGTNGNWSTAENWVGDVAPQDGDSVVVSTDGTDPANYDLGTGIDLASVTLANGSTDGALTISGGAIELDPGGQIVNNRNAANETTLAGGLSLSGSVTIAAPSDGRLSVTGQISGTGNLTKTGTGPLLLYGDNTYSGDTSLQGGLVAFAAMQFVRPFSAGQVSVSDGVVLQQMSPSGSLSNPVHLSGSVRIDVPVDLFLNGRLTGTGTLTKTGTETLWLQNGLNDYTGTMVVSVGTVRVTPGAIDGDVVNNGRLLFDWATDAVYGGSISGSGDVLKFQGGVLTLTGTNTYTGGTIVTGTLRGDSESLHGNFVSARGSGVLVFDQADDGTFAGVISSRLSVVKLGAGTLTLTGANTYENGTTISSGTLRGNATSLQRNITNNAALVFDQGSAGTYAGIISGSGTVTKTGAGTLTLTNDNTYTGQTTVSAGTLSVAPGAIRNSLTTVGSAGTLAGTGWLAGIGVDAGGKLAPGTSVGTLTASGGATLGAGSSFDVEIDGSGADRLNVDAPIQIGGAALNVTALPASTHVPGTSFTIIDSNHPVQGTFAGPNVIESGGHRFRVDYTSDPTQVRLVATNTAAPSLSGTASGPVQVGGAVTDKAALADGDTPTGQITFRLYGPSDADCSGAAVFTDTRTVSGNGDYTSSSFTPSQAGTYRWIASYSGDGGNDPAATRCHDPSQAVTVSPQPTPDPDPTPDPVPDAPDPSLEVVGLERDREEGTATLTLATNLPGALGVEKTNKVKGFGPVELDRAGTAEVEVAPRDKAARTLRRTGRVTVNPRVVFTGAGFEIGVRHEFELRQD